MCVTHMGMPWLGAMGACCCSKPPTSLTYPSFSLPVMRTTFPCQCAASLLSKSSRPHHLHRPASAIACEHLTPESHVLRQSANNDGQEARGWPGTSDNPANMTTHLFRVSKMSYILLPRRTNHGLVRDGLLLLGLQHRDQVRHWLPRALLAAGVPLLHNPHLSPTITVLDSPSNL